MASAVAMYACPAPNDNARRQKKKKKKKKPPHYDNILGICCKEFLILIL
jgi:hypothetical protein